MSETAGPLAPGRPGIGPTWSSSDKDAVGTSHLASRVWFTVGHGILNEVYWPHVDRPQVRDLGFIVADDSGFWSEVKRDATHEVRHEGPGLPAITARHAHPRYALTLRICADDHADVIRIEARLDDRRDPHDPARAEHPLRLYPLLAPHLGPDGAHGRAWTGAHRGRAMVFAQNGSATLALAADPEPLRQSVGYVGRSDGWQDFSANGRMAWAYARAEAGNVAAMLELAPGDDPVQLVLAFGARPVEAGMQASAALAGRFEGAWEEYLANWRRFVRSVTRPPAELPPEDRDLYLTSASVLRCLQDRIEPGATVASLSIPWGNTRDDVGGYHLVWSRDLVEAAGALVALGAVTTARRTLAYLVASQQPEGHWSQNQWVDGDPYWTGVQLDEAAYPLLLAGAVRAGASQMHGRPGRRAAAFQTMLADGALERMIGRAASFLARTGPATQQDRWEEDAGLAPSTLAPVVAALVVAAEHLPEPAASYALELADDWNASIEDWTYASGTQLARDHGVEGHYIRVASPDVLAGAPLSTPVPVRNRPAAAAMVPADQMVGTDFLALVRFGLRVPDDPRIVSSLVVADAVLRTETPSGPVWHRYAGDGYGEHEDGGAYDGTGVGRGWPLLVGERGHYELDAGRDARPYLAAMRRMASSGGMIPEQVWDAPSVQGRALRPGRPSGSAMPLGWAHAEYVKLVRSIALGHAIDRPEAAWRRYRGKAPKAERATWRFTAPRPRMPAGRTLRLEVLAPARARYSFDGWRSWRDLEARDTGLGVWVVDLPGSDGLAPGWAVVFTFWWPDAGHWEGRDLRVDVVAT